MFVELLYLYLLSDKYSHMFRKAFFIITILIALSQSKVHVLDDRNFTRFIQNNPLILIQVYNQKIANINSIQAEFQALAPQKDQRYVLAKANLSTNYKLKQQFKTQRPYAIYLVTNESKIEYTEVIRTSMIKAWVQEYFISKIKSINQEELNDKIGKENFLVIKGASTQQMKVLEIANFIDRTVEYYYVGQGDYGIRLYRNTKRPEIMMYTGKLIAQDITQWTFLNTLPSLVYINSEKSLKAVFQNPFNVSVFMLYKAKDLTQESFERIQQVCQRYQGNFTCGYVDSQSRLYNKTAKYFKLSDGSVSALAFLKYGLKQGYIFPNLTDFSNVTLNDFFSQIRLGKMQPFTQGKQENKGKKESSSQIKYKQVITLTDQTYKPAIQGNNFVFVEYFSNTCEKCIRFTPDYEKMAKNVKQKGIKCVIAAVDYTNNEQIQRKISIKQFPTFKLYINGAEISYKGQRDIEMMFTFIQKAINIRLKTARTQNNIPIPYIAVHGISENSPFHVLPLLHTKFPIYHILQTTQLKVNIAKHGQFSTFSNPKSNLRDVLDWIQDTTQPLVIGVAEQKNARRLNEAITRRKPLLVIVQRDSSAKNVLKVFQNYCIARFNVVCGRVTPSDYDYVSFNKWLNDKRPNNSVFVLIDTAQWKSYFYQGDLQTLKQANIQVFVNKIVTQLKKKEKQNETPRNQGQNGRIQSGQTTKGMKRTQESQIEAQTVFSEEL